MMNELARAMRRVACCVVCAWCTWLGGGSAMAQATRPGLAEAAAPATAEVAASTAAVATELADPVAVKLYERVAPSLVVVQYLWESEAGARELASMGVVVREDGLIVAPLALFPLGIPDAQMKEFKIIIPRWEQDNEELDAIFLGRDERTSLAFLKPKEMSSKEKRQWKPIGFEEAPVQAGDVVYSVGLLTKSAGYRAYVSRAMVAATLRGEVPHVLTLNGSLTMVGSPVFNPEGKAIGYVNAQRDQDVRLYDSRDPQLNMMASVNNPPKFFIPTRDFIQGLQDPPHAGEPMKLPWVAIPQMSGVRKDVAEMLGLKDQPAVEIGDVLPGSNADKAGLKRRMVIVKMNGQPLERGDEPEELPGILRRKITRMKVGQKVTFSVLSPEGLGSARSGADDATTRSPSLDPRTPALKNITVTLEERPKGPNQADRFFAEDLGFATRDLVFVDMYRKRLAAGQTGVVVSFLKPQSAAETGKLQNDDLITEFNRQKVTDVAAFRKMYEDFRRGEPREAIVMVVKREGATQVIRIEPPQ